MMAMMQGGEKTSLDDSDGMNGGVGGDGGRRENMSRSGD